MCGISGFVSFEKAFTEERKKYEILVTKMAGVLENRGPDDAGSYIGKHVAFGHRRLAVMDPERGKQPMRKCIENKDYVIVYNGELYNAVEMRETLQRQGWKFETSSDTEVVLVGYIAYGEAVVEKMNGIYSFVIWNERERLAFFCRDRLGVKPLFYAWTGRTWVFGSEIKALFEYPEINPEISRNSLCELFGIGPARIPGCGVFSGVFEVLPGYCGTFSEGGFVQRPYWELRVTNGVGCYEDAVLQVRELLRDSIERQLQSDVPLCTLLSGGIDSSVVSAVAAKYYRDRGKKLATYSFDFVNNTKNFMASAFQPEEDKKYVECMVKAIDTEHYYLECDYDDLFECLFKAVDAKDLPGMTDVDASLFYFSGKIKQRHTVCLSGECADEIFGGYPWFRAEESFEQKGFPWTRDFSFRKSILKEEVLRELPIEEYVEEQYEKTIATLPCNLFEKKISMNDYWRLSLEDRKHLEEKVKMRYHRRRERELAYLNIKWFMATLLERKDRMTMANGLEVRVPFADHRLVECLYNMPWGYKYHDKQVKSLLKDAFRDWLPREVVERKKCPYPKTYDPRFEERLKTEIKNILDNPNEPVLELVDKNYLQKIMSEVSDYGRPWFGQLMAKPQMYAYIIQINYWMKKYRLS